MLAAKQPRPKKCKNPACGEKFVPARLGQAVCSPRCGLAIKEVNQEKARKSLAEVGRKELRAAKERVKPRSQYMREAQTAFNAWVRERDSKLPCISCGRHHQGKYDAGHYRTVGSNPALRFEPLNCHKQCVPCNQHKSGDIVNYRINLLQRIGAEAVAWIEGPHEPRKYTTDDLKAIKADYQEKLRELKRAIA
ncbi:Bacteriophage Lambda NinG protein [Pseudomonas sp. NFPP05]|uniref:recombination protein NinG n=1 Tax=unclassified Pseudomonas TaxID=196821 RepID=UPI0008844E02|nr:MULTISPECIES: recombination protein NinG [unclassified Pseudomonas]SDA11135.1 Bacteriophage Lambda NinG protein [Pseudomonas sp. NFPP12]SFM12130.1 Bacteriophage Lambda NinG protein [Pseudomonas sp. NFPP05]